MTQLPFGYSDLILSNIYILNLPLVNDALTSLTNALVYDDSVSEEISVVKRYLGIKNTRHILVYTKDLYDDLTNDNDLLTRDIWTNDMRRLTHLEYKTMRGLFDINYCTLISYYSAQKNINKIDPTIPNDGFELI